MSVKLSIYDCFGYTIPGALYLFTGVYTACVAGWVQVDWLSLDLSIAQIAMSLGLAYILGLILDPVASAWFALVFRPKADCVSVLDEFRQVHQGIEINAPAADSHILLAYIRKESMEVALGIERLNANSKLLRSLCFGLVPLALVEVVQFGLTLTWPHLVLAALLVFGSLIAGKQAVKFDRWYYNGIFDAIAACGLNPSKLVSYRPQGAQPAGGTVTGASPAQGEQPGSEAQRPDQNPTP